MISLVEPEFIKADQYYFDALNNRIYGPVYHSRGYFHELSHYYDHKNTTYSKISLYMQQHIEVVAVWLFPILSIGSLIFSHIPFREVIESIGFVLFPVLIWTLQEEIRAHIRGGVWYRKHMRRLSR